MQLEVLHFTNIGNRGRQGTAYTHSHTRHTLRAPDPARFQSLVSLEQPNVKGVLIVLIVQTEQR